MDALARPEDGGVGSRPTFGMAPGGGSTGGCRVDFEHGTYLPRHLRFRVFAARKPPRQSSLRCLPTTAAPAASVCLVGATGLLTGRPAGTAEFVGQADVDDLGGRWHVHSTSNTSDSPEILEPRESDAEPEALLMAEFYEFLRAGVEPPCSGRRYATPADPTHPQPPIRRCPLVQVGVGDSPPAGAPATEARLAVRRQEPDDGGADRGDGRGLRVRPSPQLHRMDGTTHGGGGWLQQAVVLEVSKVCENKTLGGAAGWLFTALVHAARAARSFTSIGLSPRRL